MSDQRRNSNRSCQRGAWCRWKRLALRAASQTSPGKNAVPYDVTTITVKPNTHMQALPPLEQWLKANPRNGEFHRLPVLRDRRPQQDPAAASLRERDGLSPPIATRSRAARTRSGSCDFVRGTVDRHLRAVPLPAADQAGTVRADLRGAHLPAQAERPAADDRGLAEQGARAPEALADPRRDVFGHRRSHALPAYLALSEPATCARRRAKPPSKPASGRRRAARIIS